MSGALAAAAGSASSSHLDTQTVTTGGDGTAPGQDRRRGFANGVIGSIADGTSNLFGGAAINFLLWEENSGSPRYSLTIVGATDTGFTTLTINGTNGATVLTRTARTSFLSNTWIWDAPGTTLGNNAFGSISDTAYCYFD